MAARLSIQPVTPELGAEVTGVDLKSAGGDDVAAIQRAFLHTPIR